MLILDQHVYLSRLRCCCCGFAISDGRYPCPIPIRSIRKKCSSEPLHLSVTFPLCLGNQASKQANHTKTTRPAMHLLEETDVRT